MLRRRLDSRAVSALSYGLLVGLLAVVALSALIQAGSAVNSLFGRAAASIGAGAASGSAGAAPPPELGACAATNPAIGTQCADGSVFAGFASDPAAPCNGSCKLIAMLCDRGMSANGRGCTGTPGSFTWGDGVSPLQDIAALPNVAGGSTTRLSGRADTALLAATDASDSVAGFQPHLAALQCADAVEHGRDDWHLPSTAEMQTLFNNRSAIQNFRSNPPGWSVFYWTSSEIDATFAACRDFPDSMTSCHKTTLRSGGGFTLGPHIRCVRLQP